jgi:colanic acid/amylovoran biosynthesis glycosyltransferase
MVTDHFPKVSETFFVRKFLGLLRRGWDVHVVCQRSNDEHWGFFPELRSEIRHKGRLHVARENLEERVVELRPDIVHFGYGTLAHGRTHIGRAAGCRTVTSFRGYDLNSFRLDDPACYDEVWKTTDVVHAVSEAIWTRAQERGCPPQRAHRIITDAVDVSWFEPPVRDDDAVGTPDRPLRVLSIGRLHWKKGHEQALIALRDLVDRGVEVEYRIIGDGDHEEPTRFAVADLGLGDRVQLLGARAAGEVRDMLAWADVLVHPSLTEAFGVAVIEAQAMGLPVVCSDAGGLPENVEHEVTGFVVGRRDPEGIADRLAELARDASLRRRMGRARAAGPRRSSPSNTSSTASRSCTRTCSPSPPRCRGPAWPPRARKRASSSATRWPASSPSCRPARTRCACSCGARRSSRSCGAWPARRCPRAPRCSWSRAATSWPWPSRASGPRTSPRRRTASTRPPSPPTAPTRSRAWRTCARRARRTSRCPPRRAGGSSTTRLRPPPGRALHADARVRRARRALRARAAPRGGAA